MEAASCDPGVACYTSGEGGRRGGEEEGRGGGGGGEGRRGEKPLTKLHKDDYYKSGEK